MDIPKLSIALSSINTWWSGQEIPTRIKKAETKRKVFYNISEECLQNREICCISGPRQVGKTTLIGQLIEYQIKEKQIDPKRILYIPLDNKLITLNSDNVLTDTLQAYFDLVLGEAPQSLTQPIFIYLDEIQSLEDWSKHLKTYYDSFDKIKFVITGSSQTKLYTEATESLVGRIQFRQVLPLKFREFLEFHLSKDETTNDLEFSTEDLRKALKQSLKESNPSTLYKTVQQIQLKNSALLPKIKKLLNQFLIKGGYPGVLEYDDDYSKCSERIKTDLELTVYKDIYQIFGTRNSSDILSLLVLVASSSGQKVNYVRLGKAIGVDRRSISNYLHYTQLVFLTAKSPIYKNSEYKKAEKADKIYLLDTGQRNALLGKMNEQAMQEPQAGLIIQTAAFNHASKLKFYLTEHQSFGISYWQEGKNEIDIILDLPKKVLPIEVKSNSGNKSIGTVRKFISSHKKCDWGIIITGDELKLEKDIIMLPLWAFLLMC